MSVELKMAKHIVKQKLTGKVTVRSVAQACNVTQGSEYKVVQELAKLGVVASVDTKLNFIIKGNKGKDAFEVDVIDEPVPADNIKDLVKKSQYSQKELAKRLDVSKSTIYRAISKPTDKKYVEIVASLYKELGVDQPKVEGKVVTKEELLTSIDKVEEEVVNEKAAEVSKDEQRDKLILDIRNKLSEANDLITQYISI